MERKLRHSHQREMIYHYLLSSKEHPTAEMVYEHLRREMPNLSLGTVYRNLKLLEETGKVRRVTSLENTERYDARCEDHAHFVCECCGCVKDLDGLDVQQAADRLLPDGHRAQWVNVVFGGTCAACLSGTEGSAVV